MLFTLYPRQQHITPTPYVHVLGEASVQDALRVTLIALRLRTLTCGRLQRVMMQIANLRAGVDHSSQPPL